ncbi:hypothetical protein MRB53_021477 [Persea americana]|uniref:Uncharacterized protein n=1 Tax=Persea americana TaxID=3435 RepID=A0ACC2L411_PERAE|nr:hypothetical protein MRB53_021477 [Persea americana]
MDYYGMLLATASSDTAIKIIVQYLSCFFFFILSAVLQSRTAHTIFLLASLSPELCLRQQLKVVFFVMMTRKR